jgi:hypothetical protein
LHRFLGCREQVHFCGTDSDAGAALGEAWRIVMNGPYEAKQSSLFGHRMLLRLPVLGGFNIGEQTDQGQADSCWRDKMVSSFRIKANIEV